MSQNQPLPTGPFPGWDEQTDQERIQRWNRMLHQSVPVIGGWMHRRITTALVESAQAGNWLAAQSLAAVYVFHPEAEVRRLAAQTLPKINYTTGIDAVWGVWAETRHPGLEAICRGYERLAGQPASARMLSALCMEQYNVITSGSADMIPALIQAWNDNDERIAERARKTIARLKNQDSIDAVCGAWLDQRYAFLGQVVVQAGYVAQKPPGVRVLSALKVNRLDVVMQSTSDMVAPLILACQHADPEISSRARLCIAQLQQQSAIDAFCKLWAAKREPFLEQVLLQAKYIARSPAPVRLLVALKTGRRAVAAKASPEVLPQLFAATEDPDAEIRAEAHWALAHLTNEETQEALCLRVIEQDDPQARAVALANGYLPRQPETRALFLFLTGQWAAYDEVDFDQGMLRAIYEGSATPLRQRIADRVQEAGRTEYLTILAGVDFRARAQEVNTAESELLLRVLAENREYERLWKLAPELALPYSVQILRTLDDAGWQPADSLDLPLFEQLRQLSRQPMLLGGAELARVLPLAVPRTTLRVRGRVNEVAFDPQRPVLAIATSQRKVVLWNFHNAAVDRVLEGFKHSVGRVTYTPAGQLAASERTNTQGLCSVHVYENGETYHLCTHTGAVTTLEAYGEHGLLTTGRDQLVVLWDLLERKPRKHKEFPFWVRSTAISADGQYAALLHNRMSLVRLPELALVSGYTFLPPRTTGFKLGVAQNAAFSPDGRYLLAGQYNGQVGLYFHTSLPQRPRKVVVTEHQQPVRAVRFLPKHPYVVTAGAEGQVRFLRWPEMTLQGMVFQPEGQLTSLQLSRNGAFMATGSNDASLVLWDLRVLDIPALFSQPLATTSHEAVSNILALSEYYALPETVRSALKFLRLLLQYRFRYDIQIEEGPIISYGEFDILLDDL